MTVIKSLVIEREARVLTYSAISIETWKDTLHVAVWPIDSPGSFLSFISGRTLNYMSVTLDVECV